MVRLLVVICALIYSGPQLASARTVVNDVTQLNPIEVENVVAPTTVEQIQKLVAEHHGPISVGGGRFSQGGQTACTDCLFIDMRKLHRILNVDQENKTITLEAGATWRQVQEAVDPKDLAPKIMQSFSNFTIGGSLSVNCHGDYVGLGPVVSSVKSIKVVLADGSLKQASRTENFDLFRASIGGYGGVGIIVEATLDLAENRALERTSVRMKAAEYPVWRRKHIVGSNNAVLHYAILYPPAYRTANAITSSITQKPVTIEARLSTKQKPSWLDRALLTEVTYGPFGKSFRQHIFDPLTQNRRIVSWRNFDAADDVFSLEPKSRRRATYGLQEYFIPESQFEPFRERLSEILRKNDANVINISIRHATADRETLLSWAPEDVYAFVIYFEQGTDEKSRRAVKGWTHELIKAAMKSGGRQYLPYQIVATREEFLLAYPNASQFFEIKRRVDPHYKFRNKLWEAYYQQKH